MSWERGYAGCVEQRLHPTCKGSSIDEDPQPSKEIIGSEQSWASEGITTKLLLLPLLLLQ